MQVQPLFLGIPSDAQVTVDPITVPAGELVTFTSDTVAGLPDGRHAIVFDTQDAGAVAGRRAGDHAHDRGHPDDVGAARRRRPRPRMR